MLCGEVFRVSEGLQRKSSSCKYAFIHWMRVRPLWTKCTPSASPSGGQGLPPNLPEMVGGLQKYLATSERDHQFMKRVGLPGPRSSSY